MPETSGQRRRRPTIYDVARLAGVSTATVSRALNGTAPIAASTRAAIDDAIEQLGYRPNPIARSLVTKSTQTIAFLLPDITNPFYAELVSGIQQLMLEGEQSMLLCTTDGDPEQEARYLRLLRAKHVDGALVDGLGLAPERIAAFVDDGFPIVCLDRDVDFPSIPLVQVDNRLGARLATEYLVSLGHTRIAHITGAAAPISDARLEGYREALVYRRHRAGSRARGAGGLHRGGRARRDARAARVGRALHRGLLRERPVGDGRPARGALERAQGARSTSRSSASTTCACRPTPRRR